MNRKEKAAWMSRKTIGDVLKLILVVFGAFVVVQYALPIVSTEKFRVAVESLGFIGPVIIVLCQVAQQVFVPVPGTPVMILGFAIYGIPKTIVFIYVGSLISSALNFWIAKRFGRKWVIKLVGESAIKEIDEFVSVVGREVLIVSRLIGFGFFDLLSYAAGLSGYEFKEYFVISSVCNAIVMVIMAVLFRDYDFANPTTAYVWWGVMAVLGMVFAVAIKYYYKYKKQKVVG